jgi:hypothetical protein
MRDDPMRQADIERRLSNLARARRCGARTRAGHPCRQAAVTGRARCRMHGGARGSGGPQGDRNGNFKHGIWTRENVETRRISTLRCERIWSPLAEMGHTHGTGTFSISIGSSLTSCPASECPTAAHSIATGRSASVQS